MAKGAATRASDSLDSKGSSRSKRGSPRSGTHKVAASEAPDAVIHALADALRDILRDEQRARAA
ncbi:MAG: hypothetical protein JOZ69_12130 [Myxococcales bacterium]|nr:hypothetical protein [Myxococcales bacterium]